jgi:assimilatory nitrate reductase catalytic subunit
VQMFDAIDRGKIKALWVMATNPAVSLPRARAAAKALGKLDLFVVSENVVANDTVNAGAHILLPAAGWGEKDGTVTNSERRISRQRAFLPAPGEAKPDWWIVAQVAHRMGYREAFHYESAAEIFREHAALSSFENGLTRDFDIGGLAKIDDGTFNALDPVQWPARANGARGTSRLFGDGKFFTPDGKARMIAPDRPALSSATSAQFPFRLNTGRIRDQWHTMTRSGLSPRLAHHKAEPFVEVHPADAAACKLVDGGFAGLRSPHGTCVLKVVITESQQRGSLFAPIHWSDETASCARIGELVTAANDPYSGQPEAKATPVAIRPEPFAYRAFMLANERPTLPEETWWARLTMTSGVGLLLASNDGPAIWRARAATLFDAAETAEYLDEPRGIYRVAGFSGGRLTCCLFLGRSEAAPTWDAVKASFEAEKLDDGQRRAVLSGKSTEGIEDPGPVVCACFGVGLNVIRGAIAGGRAVNVDEIGRTLRAGTNCGSCLPELKRIISRESIAQTA